MTTGNAETKIYGDMTIKPMKLGLSFLKKHPAKKKSKNFILSKKMGIVFLHKNAENMKVI